MLKISADNPIINNFSSFEEVNDSKITSIAQTSLQEPYEDFEFVEKPKDIFRCSVIPSLHSTDTHEWRKKLVAAAQHNIVISGNFCGGGTFDELLLLIDQRMEAVPGLEVVIIGHPMFLENRPDDPLAPFQNQALLDKLTKKYPKRFNFVSSPNGLYGSKIVSNHTKCTVIDYGKYYIQGGSGIKECFAGTGTYSISKEEFVAQENGKKIDKSELSSRKIMNSRSKTLMESFLPTDLRDQDFIFQCSDTDMECGKKMYREALYLAYKWDQHEKSGYLGKYLPPESWELSDLTDQYEIDSLVRKFPALMDMPASNTPTIDEEENVLYRMLKTQLPDLSKIDTALPAFAHNSRKVDNVAVRLFFTGPEQHINSFEQALIDRLEKATDRIILNQMYFHPSNAVMTALINATKRGIKVTIISNGMTKNCPYSHQFFGPRNRYNYYYLTSSLTEEQRKNVTVYEYSEDNIGNHKKITIIDDTIIGGSSNMGYKSLVLMADHEMNFEASSKDLVSLTFEHVIKEDIKHSIILENPHQISLMTMIRAGIHSIGARFWG